MTNVTYYADELEFQENYRNLEFPHIVHIQSNGRTIFLKDENTIPALQENMFIFISQENNSLPADCSSPDSSQHTKGSIRDCFHYEELGERRMRRDIKLNNNRQISINQYERPLQISYGGGDDADLDILYNIKNTLHTVEIPAVNFVGTLPDSLFTNCNVVNLVLHGGDIAGLLLILRNSEGSHYSNIYYPYWFDINTVPTNMRPSGNYIKFVPA